MARVPTETFEERIIVLSFGMNQGYKITFMCASLCPLNMFSASSEELAKLGLIFSLKSKRVTAEMWQVITFSNTAFPFLPFMFH